MVKVIETLGLTKYYGKVRGVEELNLEVREGEAFGFLGPNGAGKTTTIRLLLDLIRPTRGEARVFGLEVRKNSLEIRRRLGNLPEELSLYENLTGEELLNYLGRYRSRVDTQRRKELAERLDIDLSRKIKGYSTGMKQKVGIIQALMHDPDLLVLDEPTLGLDPLVQQEVLKMLGEEKERGKTIFMSSHILPEVERICDRVGVIREGRLAAVEDIAELREKSLKRVEVRFSRPLTVEDLGLSGVSEISWDGRSLHFSVAGRIDPVVKRLAQWPIEDLEIHHASLEEFFLQFYTSETGNGGA